MLPLERGSGRSAKVPLLVHLFMPPIWLTDGLPLLPSLAVRATKQKTVISGDKSQMERVRRLVDAGRYPSVSDFVREALAEKLERLDEASVAEAVERYCKAGHADEDIDLIDRQGFDVTPAAPRRKRSARATR